MLFDGDNLNEVRDERPTRLRWEVNIKSMQEEEFPKMWVGSLINCCRPNCEVTASRIDLVIDIKKWNYTISHQLEFQKLNILVDNENQVVSKQANFYNIQKHRLSYY